MKGFAGTRASRNCFVIVFNGAKESAHMNVCGHLLADFTPKCLFKGLT